MPQLREELRAYYQPFRRENREGFPAESMMMGRYTRATPDGRRDGDELAQGVAPDRHTHSDSFTNAFHTLSHIDFRDYPGNAVLDAMLPTGSAIPTPTLSAVLRTFAQLHGPTLQLNYAPLADLLDAQAHPSRHHDLVVRISGLSAYFVCLDKDVQDEIIGRNVNS